MVIFNGESVSSGIAMGPVYYYKKIDNNITRKLVQDYGSEIKRFLYACEQAAAQLQELCADSVELVGESAAQIFEIQSMMIEDHDYQNYVIDLITSEKVNAEFAVFSAEDFFKEYLKDSGVTYIEERKSDVKDITARIMLILNPEQTRSNIYEEPVILVTDDLTPSETVHLDRDKILGILMRNGSINSHTAILARTMGIPAVTLSGVDFPDSLKVEKAILDADKSRLIINPDPDMILKYRKLIELAGSKQDELKKFIGKKSITSSGQSIKLYANIGALSDIEAVKENDAEGIGLFRSEFIFLEREELPSEEEQFLIYKNAAENMSGAEVIIRTLDVGADKQLDYLGLLPEFNPALGMRGIRLCFEKPQIFKTQLRAIYRASAYGNIAVMFPMIISVEEIVKIKKIIKEVCIELVSEGQSCRQDLSIGIMIETPAAAILSSELAEEVDFFSIGTNDLTQYTLCIDRQNPYLSKYTDRNHKAVLDLIKLTVANAHKKGIEVGICGEMASYPELTEFFIEAGIDELSVSPPQILPLRKRINSY